MRKIGTLPSERDAQRFSAYLTAHQMPSQADAARDGTWEIWVHDDGHLSAATAELDTFLQDPANGRYIEGARTAARQKEEQAADLKRSRSRIIDARSQWGAFRNAGLGQLTMILIGACIGIFIMQQMNPEGGLRYFLMMTTPEGAASGALLPEIFRGQVWRVFTPALMHGGVLHLLFNMMWLRTLGSSIEVNEGAVKLGLQVLAFAIVGNLLQYFYKGPWFLGMSGVVYGLFGYIWVCSKHDPSRAYTLDRETVIIMGAWFLLCFTGLLGSVANGAHVGGLIAGILWATISVRQIPYTKIRF